MNNDETINSVERFIRYQDYQKATGSAYPFTKCKDCAFLFTFKKKTRCYVYEQQKMKDCGIEFHPRRDFNCSMFQNSDDSDDCATEIYCYLQALKKGVDPKNDADYIKALDIANAACDSRMELEKREACLECNNREDWDDPNTYANCSDWEDEPENCFHCADDECPMNKS